MTDLTDLKRRVEVLEAALRPFALVAEHDIGIDEYNEDRYRPMLPGHNRAPLITVGDLRRAAALLSACEQGGAK